MRRRRPVAALERDGWRVLAQRLRTEAGEIDVVAAKGTDVLAIIEVKARPTLADAAMALGAAAAGAAAGGRRDRAGGTSGVGEGRDALRSAWWWMPQAPVRRIADAFRWEN